MRAPELTIIVGPSNMAVGATTGDPTFDTLATSGLVWLPEHGMGFYPVREQPYDAAYFRKYEGYAATPMGQAITGARLAMVRRWLDGGPLIDVGIGCGDFLEAAALSGLEAYGCDINPAGVAWLNRRGLFRDPYHEHVSALSFWDALEHIPDVHRMLAHARDFVFCALPLVPGHGPPPANWKHLRRDEHCWYWTRQGFERWMRAQGFECVEFSAIESSYGREDIGSFAFRRSAP